MGKKKSNLKESENGNPIKLSESPAKKSINSGQSKASILASLFFITFIAILSIILGLIFIEINSSSKDLNSGILKHDAIKKEAVPHHVKETQSRASRSKEALPPSSPPSKSESKTKMDDTKTKASSDADIEAEHLVKKLKIEEDVAKKYKTDKELPIKEEKLVEIEKQIIKDHSDEKNRDKKTKSSEKDETSKPSAATGKSKVEEKPEKVGKPDDKVSEEAKPEATLKELYIEVEGLAEDILQEDPQNSMVKELAPHLEAVLKDLEEGKLSGLRDSLLHIKIILSDLKERLEESKHKKESDTSKPPKPDSEASKPKDERVPVDEVIPDPVYIAPLGDDVKDVLKEPSEKSTSDKVPKVETKKREEKKTQDQPKKSVKVDDAKVSQPPHTDKEKQQKSENIPQEKKTKNIISEEEVVQSGKESKEAKDNLKVKPKDKQQKKDTAKDESEKIKDKIVDEKSSKIEKSSEDKSSKTRQDKRKLSETEKEVKTEKVEETPTDKKLKASPEKVKRETKSSTVEDLNQESDKKNLDVKQAKKSSENEELKRTQKDTVKTTEQSSKKFEQHEKPADKSEESNIKLKDKDLLSTKKLEDAKASEKQPKKEKISPDSKESKEKLKEENLKKSSEETPTVEKASVKERQEVSGTEKEKKAKKNEGKSSAPTNTHEKPSPETLDKTTEEVKSSEIDEKLKLASALEDENLMQALSMYDSLYREMPKSHNVLYRRALVLDNLSVVEQSNPRLEQTIHAYLHILALSSEINVPKDILKDVGLRCVARMNFRGPSMFGKSREVLRFLTKNFYDDVLVLNKVGIYYLIMNRNEEAGFVFERVLELSPEDGIALVHYGFVLKLRSTDEASLIEAISYLERGINSDADGVHDVRMYYHLGDALQRLGQNERAYQVYDEGVSRGLFRSRYQRSTHNIDRLKAKPLWSIEETAYEQFFKKIQSHWKEISSEGKLALNINNEGKSNIGFREEKENLREKGSWKQLELFARGKKHTENCKLAPFTCSLIEEFEPAAGCKAGQTKFSVMEPGTHVFPHSGPTNHRLRSHLGLITPDGARMRVLNETLMWEEGKLFIFDDSFEHEVWHEGNNSLRLILIVDVWHPQLTVDEIRTIRPI